MRLWWNVASEPLWDPALFQAAYHCGDCWWNGKHSSRCESCGSLKQLKLAPQLEADKRQDLNQVLVTSKWCHSNLDDCAESCGIMRNHPEYIFFVAADLPQFADRFPLLLMFPCHLQLLEGTSSWLLLRYVFHLPSLFSKSPVCGCPIYHCWTWNMQAMTNYPLGIGFCYSYGKPTSSIYTYIYICVL